MEFRIEGRFLFVFHSLMENQANEEMEHDMEIGAQ